MNSAEGYQQIATYIIDKINSQQDIVQNNTNLHIAEDNYPMLVSSIYYAIRLHVMTKFDYNSIPRKWPKLLFGSDIYFNSNFRNSLSSRSGNTLNWSDDLECTILDVIRLKKEYDDANNQDESSIGVDAKKQNVHKCLKGCREYLRTKNLRNAHELGLRFNDIECKFYETLETQLVEFYAAIGQPYIESSQVAKGYFNTFLYSYSYKTGKIERPYGEKGFTAVEFVDQANTLHSRYLSIDKAVADSMMSGSTAHNGHYGESASYYYLTQASGNEGWQSDDTEYMRLTIDNILSEKKQSLSLDEEVTTLFKKNILKVFSNSKSCGTHCQLSTNFAGRDN